MSNQGRDEPSPATDVAVAALAPEHQTLRGLLQRISATGEFMNAIGESSEAVIVFDAERRVLGANRRAEALFGFDRGELDGRSTDALIPERLRQPNAPAMSEMTDIMQVELPGLLRDGSERPIEWCFGSVRAGEYLVFVLTMRDRIEAQRAVARLKESEQRFQLFVNAVRDCAIYMLDAEGRVSSWNAGAKRVKGWDAEEVMGQSFEVFFTPEDRLSGLPARLLAKAESSGSHGTTGWRVRKDGTRFWVEGSLTALRDERGVVCGFAKITRDLTERLRAEENERRLVAERAARMAAEEAEQRIRASEERLSRLQRATAALSEAATPEDVAEAVLRECGGAFGAASAVFSVSEGHKLVLLGQRGHYGAVGHCDVPLAEDALVTDAATRGEALFFRSRSEFLARYPSEPSSGSFEASVALPLVARGKPIGVLVLGFCERRDFQSAERTMLLTMSDLCAQALDRAGLFGAEREARATAEAANRAKDEFLGMLGHELRNPLAPISTALELLKTHPHENGARERAVIERQVTHLQRLVDDLLDVSRVARGLISLSLTPTPVADILSKALETARPLIDQRMHRLTVSTPGEDLAIRADLVRMAQAVSNLLINAASYTPHGGHIWVDAWREADDAVISVRDDGEGIDAELLPRVFDLFVQGQRGFERSKGGLGLGLAIVKNLVGLHGGTVSVKSSAEGSEFIVRVPVLAGVPEAAPLSDDRPQPALGGTRRILLVDDNEDARELLGDMLRTFGHEVEAAPDGPAALARLEKFSPDVAILDLGLPGMDGFELAQRISETLKDARPRLIALTGYGRESDVKQGRAVGFDLHLVKPVDIPVLVTAIDQSAVLVR
jgi:PAS domain S-box-containing protein